MKVPEDLVATGVQARFEAELRALPGWRGDFDALEAARKTKTAAEGAAVSKGSEEGESAAG